MRVAGIVLCSLLASGCRGAGLSDGFLARTGTATGTAARRAASARLGAGAVRLAGSLRRALLDLWDDDDPELIKAARARLVEEAERQAGPNLQEPSAARLLGVYALLAPPAVLLAPWTPEPLQAAESVSLASLAGGRGDTPEKLMPGAAFRDRQFAAAARDMAHEMWLVNQSFGRPGLEDLMHDIFAADDGLELHVPQGNATASKGGQEVESMSSSTELVIRDGKAIEHRRECKNGKCMTSVAHDQIVVPGSTANSSGMSRDGAKGKAVTMQM